jgi:hypothetical protein
MVTFAEPTLLPGLKSEINPGAGLEVRNFSVAQQIPTDTTREQIVGSQLLVPPSGLKVGSKIKFVLDITKTGAGSASSVFDISFGTAGTVADTARVSFTKIAGTAVADVGRITVEAVVRTIQDSANSVAGIVVGQFTLQHSLAITGHATQNPVSVVTVSSDFDNSGQELFIGLNITMGASDAMTIEMVEATLSGV